MNIQGIDPPISNRLKEKLYAVVAPSRLDSTSGKYHIGYERAKQDLREVLDRELN